MRVIATTATAVLPPRVAFARAWDRGWVAATDHGAMVVLDATLTVAATIDAGGPVMDVSLADALIVADRQALRVFDPRTGALRWRVAGEHLACRHAGAWLWTAERRASDALVAVAREPASGAVIREFALDDPFGGADVMLFAHPEPGAVVAWIAAGQDGQVTYAVTAAGHRELAPRDCLPPVFVASGETYLSLVDGALEHRRHAAGAVIAAAKWPDDADGPGDDVQAIPGGFASWASEYGRLQIVDLATMAFVDEVVIAGHPHRPFAAGEPTPSTSFHCAVPGPAGLILSVHTGGALAVTRIADWGAHG
jgi:hypothetical protein